VFKLTEDRSGYDSNGCRRRESTRLLRSDGKREVTFISNGIRFPIVADNYHRPCTAYKLIFRDWAGRN
jgi:hypothetical protein